MLLPVFIIKTVQLSVCNACLVLVEKLIRFGVLMSTMRALLRLSMVRDEKTATLCLCLTVLALRRELLLLMWLCP